jgi:hypothetical protein
MLFEVELWCGWLNVNTRRIFVPFSFFPLFAIVCTPPSSNIDSRSHPPAQKAFSILKTCLDRQIYQANQAQISVRRANAT